MFLCVGKAHEDYEGLVSISVKYGVVVAESHSQTHLQSAIKAKYSFSCIQLCWFVSKISMRYIYTTGEILMKLSRNNYWMFFYNFIAFLQTEMVPTSTRYYPTQK